MKLTKHLLFLLLLSSMNVFAESMPSIFNANEAVVYRSPTCGCCKKWVDHLEDKGFKVQDNVTEDMNAIKDKYGVPRNLASCHTAIINGYVVEGHVPADDIIKMMAERPEISGISVPGMPVGTPGMEMGGKKDPFKVISFDEKNQYKIYNQYEGK